MDLQLRRVCDFDAGDCHGSDLHESIRTQAEQSRIRICYDE